MIRLIQAFFLSLLWLVSIADARTITGSAFIRQRTSADSLLYSVKVQNVSGGTATQWAQFGVPIKQGDIPSGKHLRLKSAAGAVLTQQHDQIVTNTDGSLRFAVASIRTTSLANNDSLTVNVYRSDTSTDTSSALNADTVLNSDYTMSIVISGTTWTASLDTAIAQHSRYTAHGACRRSWRAWAPFFSGSTKHAQLWCRWYVDFWADTNISVFPQVINGYFKNGASYTIDSWSFDRGATTLRSSTTDVTHHHHSIWMPCTTTGEPQWSRTAQKTLVKFPTTILGNTKFGWYYGAYTPGTASSITYSPLTNGDILKATGTTGNRRDLGPLPAWSVDALTAQSAAHDRADYINALGWMAAPIQVYDSLTGEVVNLDAVAHSGVGTAYPDGGWNYRTGIGGHDLDWTGASGNWSSTGGDEDIDDSHIPEPEVYPYIKKGYYWLIDAQLTHANNCIGWQPWSYNRNTVLNGVTYECLVVHNGHQIRGTAWALRTIDNADWLCPDGHSAKTYINAICTRNWNAMDTVYTYAMASDQKALCSWNFGEWDAARSITQPYMEDYISLVQLQGYMRGRNTLAVNQHVGKFTMRGYVPNGFYNYPGYAMKTQRCNDTSYFYTVWDSVKIGTSEEGCATMIPFLNATAGLSPTSCFGNEDPGGCSGLLWGISNAAMIAYSASDSMYIKGHKLDSLFNVHMTIGATEFADDAKYFIRRP